MKTVLFLVVVLCISLAFGPSFVAHAQIGGSGGVTTKGPNGESYKVEFYGSLIVGPNRLLSRAMMQGKGQYILAAEKILVTSGKVIEISNEALTIQINGKAKAFKLTKTTKICDGSESLEPSDIKKDDMVTITSKIDQQTALSIRKGPMLFGGIMSPPLVLKKYKCEE